jgi:hypothetical protein
MSSVYLQELEPDRRQAVQELMSMIAARFNQAEFLIEPGIDDSQATHITAVVDIDDPDEVMDLVIDRLIELQVDAGLPISIIPIRTPKRLAALLREQQQFDHAEALLPPAQV